MTTSQLPKWILIVSGIIALMELAVSMQMSCAPESMLDMVDLKATGVDYVVQMWAVRQFALGVIFAFATLKKSAPMLTLAYVFFLVMFLGDLVVGIGQKEIALIAGGTVFTVVSVVLLLAINKGK